MRPRLENRASDDVERKKFLEDDLKGQIPVSVEAELPINQTGSVPPRRWSPSLT